MIIECPNHQGSFDCTPFCDLCGGDQEIERETQMNTYTLTATLDRNTNRKTIQAPNESLAMMQAIDHIMDKAWQNKNGAWAKGAIKLTDNQGNLVAEMGEK